MDMEHTKLFYSLLTKEEKWVIFEDQKQRTKIAVIFTYELHCLVILNFYDGGV